MQWHHYTRGEISRMQGNACNVVQLPNKPADIERFNAAAEEFGLTTRMGAESVYYGFWGDNRWREIIKDVLDAGVFVPADVLAEYERQLAWKRENFPHYEQKGSRA